MYWNENSPLGVRMTKRGVRMFIVTLGSGRCHTIGQYPIVTLSQARAARLGVWTYDPKSKISKGKSDTTHTNEYLYRGLAGLARQLPAERHGDINPLRSLIEAGVKVSFATDNVPVSSFMPISHAVARVPYGSQQPVAPEQALSRADALRCATTNGAYLTFDEDKKGSLEPGKLADLAVLSADPLTVAQDGLADIRALLTIAGGRTVHETPNWLE